MTTEIIHRELPDMSVIGLSMFEEGEQASAMREAGAARRAKQNGDRLSPRGVPMSWRRALRHYDRW